MSKTEHALDKELWVETSYVLFSIINSCAFAHQKIRYRLTVECGPFPADLRQLLKHSQLRIAL